MKNQNEYAEYKDVVSGRWDGVSKDGAILMQDLEAGTYDVTVSSYSGTVSTTVYNLKTQKAAYGTDDGMYAIAAENGTKIMSINLLVDDEEAPVIWRGPVIGGAVKQFWTDVIW